MSSHFVSQSPRSSIAGIPSSANDARVARRSSRVGAFFDMDKTIIAENSGSIYMKHRYEKGEVSSWELVKGVSAYLQYKVGVLDIASWTKQMMLDLAGQLESELEVLGREIFREKVAPTIYPEAADLIAEHQRRGDIVVIVSGSTRFIVEPLARCLGIDHFLYTRLEVEGGCFTGRVVEPLCFEEGKIYWLQQFVEEFDIDFARSWFYTDSITDVPLLDLVGHPVVTNPDPLLYREAVRRCWPVRIFDPPRGS